MKKGIMEVCKNCSEFRKNPDCKICEFCLTCKDLQREPGICKNEDVAAAYFQSGEGPWNVSGLSLPWAREYCEKYAKIPG